MSAFAMTLPAPGIHLVEIDQRQTLVRRGVFFQTLGRHRRALYEQLGGEVILGDCCTCSTDWTPDFTVTRSPRCPIDWHRMEIDA